MADHMIVLLSDLSLKKMKKSGLVICDVPMRIASKNHLDNFRYTLTFESVVCRCVLYFPLIN